MELRLTVVTLGVDDMKRARAFYEQGMGLAPQDENCEAVAFYRCGPAVLALYPRPLLAEDATLPHSRIAAPGSFDGVTLACNCAGREDVDALLKKAEAAGARIAKPAQETFWGGYSGYFEDPDGHLWEAVWAPMFLPLDDRGGITLPEKA